MGRQSRNGHCNTLQDEGTIDFPQSTEVTSFAGSFWNWF